MILPDSNIWIYSFDADLQPAHDRASRWLAVGLEEGELLVPATVETEVIDHLSRQLSPGQAREAISSFLAHPGTFAPLTVEVNRLAARLLLDHPDRGIGGRDAAILVTAKQHDATLVTHDAALFEVARDWGLDAHDPVAPDASLEVA